MSTDQHATRIFLDSGDPNETKDILERLGSLDGQTTNPSLVAENPALQERMQQQGSISNDELMSFYKDVVQEVADLVPNGSVSIEVYADHGSRAEDLMEQADEMWSWIDNAHIKLPIIEPGLEAAQQLIADGKRVNMTLNFTQEQAAAVYSATKGATQGDVFVSPFEGRIHDCGRDGMDLIENEMRMFREKGDGHVEVLMASVRDMKHFMYGLYTGVDIITAPYDVLREWADAGTPLPGVDIDEAEVQQENEYLHGGEATEIPYNDLELERDWHAFDISHPQTDEGLHTFAEDWNRILGKA